MRTSPVHHVFPHGRAAAPGFGITEGTGSPLWQGGQVLLAPRSCVFPTKHVVCLRDWDCQVHAMFLPPVKLPSSAHGENFTSLKGSFWDPGHALMAAIQISH